MKNLTLAAGIALAVTALSVGLWQAFRQTRHPGMPRVTPHFMDDLMAQRDHVTVVLSGRLMAEIVPCGCRANRNGGIARLATALRSVQQRSPNSAVFDAGDSLVSADAQGKSPVSALTKKKAQVMADFEAATPHDAVALGDLDMLRGPAEAARLLRDRGLAPILTNVRFADPAVNITGHTAWITGGYRFVAMNVFSKEAVAGVPGAEWNDPVAAVEAEVKAAGPADVLLIACHRLGDDLTRRVSQTPGPPRIMIDADGTSKVQTLERTSRAMFVRLSPNPSMMFYVELYLQKGAPAWYLTPRYKSFARNPEEMEVEATAAMDCQLADVGFVVVDEGYIKDPPVAMMAERYREWTRKSEHGPAPGGDETAPKYAGAEACGACHTAQLANWKSTMHSRAWESLEKAPDDAVADPECASCHVSGLFRPGGPQRLTDIALFKGVQCENCHAPLAKHPGGEKHPAVAASTCTACHSETRDPEFNFDKYLKFATCTQPHDPASNRVPR